MSKQPRRQRQQPTPAVATRGQIDSVLGKISDYQCVCDWLSSKPKSFHSELWVHCLTNTLVHDPTAIYTTSLYLHMPDFALLSLRSRVRCNYSPAWLRSPRRAFENDLVHSNLVFLTAVSEPLLCAFCTASQDNTPGGRAYDVTLTGPRVFRRQFPSFWGVKLYCEGDAHVNQRRLVLYYEPLHAACRGYFVGRGEKKNKKQKTPAVMFYALAFQFNFSFCAAARKQSLTRASALIFYGAQVSYVHRRCSGLDSARRLDRVQRWCRVTPLQSVLPKHWRLKVLKGRFFFFFFKSSEDTNIFPGRLIF